MKSIVILVIIFGIITITAGILTVALRKGNKRKIHIVRKYIDNNPPVEDKKKNKKELSKYVVEYRIEKEDDIKVKRCDKEMYDKFRIGRDYEVKMKKKEIESIIKG